jgi:dienelactone hydrolase
MDRAQPRPGAEREVRVPTAGVELQGGLAVPDSAQGVVLFAHGSGSSRHSPRNQYVARVLRQAGLGTLLMDLLTADEEGVDQYTRHLRFDIELLALRLIGATDWLRQQPATRDLAVGYFGASTGAGATLLAAAERPDVVRAVVSRGGRPDLAGPALMRVHAPTLLIVGGADAPVIDLNERAMELLDVDKELHVIPGATHLFEEPGALEEVARLAAAWFVRHLAPAHAGTK